jgi:hypothetical protein
MSSPDWTDILDALRNACQGEMSIVIYSVTHNLDLWQLVFEHVTRMLKEGKLPTGSPWFTAFYHMLLHFQVISIAKNVKGIKNPTGPPPGASTAVLHIPWKLIPNATLFPEKLARGSVSKYPAFIQVEALWNDGLNDEPMLRRFVYLGLPPRVSSQETIFKGSAEESRYYAMRAGAAIQKQGNFLARQWARGLGLATGGDETSVANVKKALEALRKFAIKPIPPMTPKRDNSGAVRYAVWKELDERVERTHTRMIASQQLAMTNKMNPNALVGSHLDLPTLGSPNGVADHKDSAALENKETALVPFLSPAPPRSDSLVGTPSTAAMTRSTIHIENTLSAFLRPATNDVRNNLFGINKIGIISIVMAFDMAMWAGELLDGIATWNVYLYNLFLRALSNVVYEHENVLLAEAGDKTGKADLTHLSKAAALAHMVVDRLYFAQEERHIFVPVRRRLSRAEIDILDLSRYLVLNDPHGDTGNNLIYYYAKVLEDKTATGEAGGGSPSKWGQVLQANVSARKSGIQGGMIDAVGAWMDEFLSSHALGQPPTPAVILEIEKIRKAAAEALDLNFEAMLVPKGTASVLPGITAEELKSDNMQRAFQAVKELLQRSLVDIKKALDAVVVADLNVRNNATESRLVMTVRSREDTLRNTIEKQKRVLENLEEGLTTSRVLFTSEDEASVVTQSRYEAKIAALFKDSIKAWTDDIRQSVVEFDAASPNPLGYLRSFPKPDTPQEQLWSSSIGHTLPSSPSDISPDLFHSPPPRTMPQTRRTSTEERTPTLSPDQHRPPPPPDQPPLVDYILNNTYNASSIEIPVGDLGLLHLGEENQKEVDKVVAVVDQVGVDDPPAGGRLVQDAIAAALGHFRRTDEKDRMLRYIATEYGLRHSEHHIEYRRSYPLTDDEEYVVGSFGPEQAFQLLQSTYPDEDWSRHKEALKTKATTIPLFNNLQTMADIVGEYVSKSSEAGDRTQSEGLFAGAEKFLTWAKRPAQRNTTPSVAAMVTSGASARLQNPATPSSPGGWATTAPQDQRKARPKRARMPFHIVPIRA